MQELDKLGNLVLTGNDTERGGYVELIIIYRVQLRLELHVTVSSLGHKGDQEGILEVNKCTLMTLNDGPKGHTDTSSGSLTIDVTCHTC